MSFLVAYAEDTLPLALVVNREGAGGVTGLSPTVALRRGTNAEYLDWQDSSWKTSGWSVKYAALTEAEQGHYTRVLDLTAVQAEPGQSFIAQYSVDGGAGSRGVAVDEILVVNDAQLMTLVQQIDTVTQGMAPDLSLLRKALTNRMEESPGSPGQLTLFDDDNFTVLLRWALTDYLGRAVLGAAGAPARRSARL